MSTTTKKTSMKGKRYTDEQKQELVSFVEKYNSENGRGGQSAASAKFGVSQLTIAGWLKSAGSPAASKKGATKVARKGGKRGRPAKVAAPSAGKSSGSGINAKVAALVAVGNQIEKVEKELAQLLAKFDTIKASL